MGKSIKYKRGSIWLYRCSDDNSTRAGFRTHVQNNSRPVLIISSDYGNMHSPVLNVVPLTTADKPCSVNVAMDLEDGTINYILCNQIKTIDAKELVHYISTADDETMAEVEKTINYALGISAPRIEKSLKDIETMIQNIVTMKFNELSNRDEFDNIVENIAKGLESTYENLMVNYITNLNSASRRLREAAPELSNKIDKHKVFTTSNEKEDSSVIDINDKLTKKKKRNYTPSNKPRGYWTPERKAKYVEDYNSNTVQWMMLTYEIDTEEQVKKRYQQYKYEINKEKVD